MTASNQTTVLVLGATGVLSNAMLRRLADSSDLSVVGTALSAGAVRLLRPDLQARIRVGVDVENTDALVDLFAQVQPAVVINCVGLVKQLVEADDALSALPVKAFLPHCLSRLRGSAAARLVHISTDGVFAGIKSAYQEADVPDAQDLYGRSKLLGEVCREAHTLTLRPSIIGHKLAGTQGLVGWLSPAGVLHELSVLHPAPRQRAPAAAGQRLRA
jgi:dTDP-4-dehydrorhamnose reductase